MEYPVGQVSVAFRVEAGGVFGSGHLIRSLALAEEVALYSPVRFIVSISCIGTELIRRKGFPIDVIRDVGGPIAVDDSVTALRAHAVSTLVTDFDGLEPAYLEALRSELPSLRIVSLDDQSIPPGVPDLLVRPHAVETWWPPAGPRVLLGPRYWMLRRAFDPYVAVAERAVAERVRRVLVLPGGTQTGDVVAEFVRAVGEFPEVEVDAVIGPLVEGLEPLQRAASELGARARLHRDPQNLPELMATADVCVSAGGYSLYELAALGTPTIAFAQVPHQVETLRALQRLGALCAVFSTRSDWAARVVEELAALVEDPGRRSLMAVAGRRLVDGGGRRRVAAAVLGS